MIRPIMSESGGILGFAHCSSQRVAQNQGHMAVVQIKFDVVPRKFVSGFIDSSYVKRCRAFELLLFALRLENYSYPEIPRNICSNNGLLPNVCAIIPGHVFLRCWATNAKAQQVGSMWVRSWSVH